MENQNKYFIPSIEDIKRMLIEVGVNSYFAGQSETTMKPSLIAEKYIYDNLLTEEDKEKLKQFINDREE